MTDEELINEHRWRWNAWMRRRVQFGELGATGDNRMMELEREAQMRGISEQVLLEGCVKSLSEVHIGAKWIGMTPDGERYTPEKKK